MEIPPLWVNSLRVSCWLLLVCISLSLGLNLGFLSRCPVLLLEIEESFTGAADAHVHLLVADVVLSFGSVRHFWCLFCPFLRWSQMVLARVKWPNVVLMTAGAHCARTGTVGGSVWLTLAAVETERLASQGMEEPAMKQETVEGMGEMPSFRTPSKASPRVNECNSGAPRKLGDTPRYPEETVEESIFGRDRRVGEVGLTGTSATADCRCGKASRQEMSFRNGFPRGF